MAAKSCGVRRNVMIAVIGLLVAGAPVMNAWALDKNQIVQMTKLGLDVKAIKGAIDSAGEELMLGKDEVEELKAQGVSKEVIDYLGQTGHLKDAMPPAPTTPAPGTGAAPAGAVPGGPAPGGAPVPGGLAPGGVAPGEEPPDPNAALDAQKVQELINLIKGFEKDKAKAEAQLGGKNAQVTAAINAIDDGQTMAAAKTCLAYQSAYNDYLKQVDALRAKIGEANIKLDVNTEVSPETATGFYNSNFCLAKALYNANILAGASRPLVEVLQAGPAPDRPYFKEAFYMLEDVSAKIGYKPPVLEEITASNIQSFNDDFQNDFNYYFGRFFYDYGRMDDASKLLGQVKKGAPDYPEAQYLQGVAVLGTVQQEDDLFKAGPKAIRFFQDAIVSAEAEPGGNAEILQLGYLSIARTFYDVGYYDVALYYYQKLPTTSSRNAEATLETAWTYFLKNDHKRALGIFHMLGSPYYAKWFNPELDLLEAAVYLNMCKFDQSKLALAQLDQKYLRKKPALEAFVEKMQTQEPSKAWNVIEGYYTNRDAQTQTGLPQLFVDALLDDLAFFNVYKEVQALRAERQALTQGIDALGEFGQTVLAQVDDRLKVKVDEGGLLILNKFNALQQDLLNLESKSLEISIDIDNEERENLERKLRNPDAEQQRGAGGTTLLIVADDWHPWPFEGEYWLDEVPNYRSNLRTECVEQ